MSKYVIAGALIVAILFIAPIAYVASPVVRATWISTKAMLDSQKQKRQEREYQKRLKSVRSQHSDPSDFLKPAKVRPNVRDLPD